MPLASDNRFPSIRMVPTAAASVPLPATGSERIFLDASDSNKLKRKNAAGAVTAIEGSGGGGGGGEVTTAQLNAVDASAVHKTGTLNETIDGIKTFVSPVVIPEPTATNHAASKNYVDVKVGTGAVTQATFDAEKAATVHKADAETITGVKTFSASPLVPTPTTASQAVPKSYVDARVVSDSTPATIDYNTTTSAYPERSTATSSTGRKVIWMGPVAPTSGGNYALANDVWWKTT